MKTSAVVFLLMLFSVSMALDDLLNNYMSPNDLKFLDLMSKEGDESNDKKVVKNQPIH